MVTVDIRRDSEILKSIWLKLGYLISLCSLQGLGKRLVNVCVLFSDFTFNVRLMAPEHCVSGRQCIQAHPADLDHWGQTVFLLSGRSKKAFL